ncbi:flagellar biosynthesis anti-sigma factor FlgM [Paenibacillus sp. JX-17]|uniref:Negative regulator of flagellin synthesis n=1 Tax=Paenibacillus lacisoli TaxID=3064525 RepID=A0ABT9CBC1_9BACL|nr:flagellar biosynthesis anti-sigma factor FlgM [Paenibacillus sp. JX-17]MDO7906560.1 flagellar biosynthesis anti-sigma factor FlgM [Paenibacillus sp. JX-17]
MKINETNRVGAINSYQRNVEAGRTEEKKSRRKDEVSISSEALEMLQRSSDPERAQKIQALKQQVASGNYQVDAGKLADKLLPFFKS